MQKPFYRIIDWFIPPALREGDSDRLMARTFVLLHILGPLMGLALWSFAQQWFWPSLLPTGFTLRWYQWAATVPNVFRSLQMSLIVAAIVTLATTVIFLMLIQLTKAIGGKGLIPPDLAAWVPGVIFGLIGLVLMVRVRSTLELDRGVLDVEVLIEAPLQLVQEGGEVAVVEAGVGHDDMSGEHRESGGYLARMEVVHVVHVWVGEEAVAHRSEIQPTRGGFHQDVDALAQQLQGARDDQHADHERGDSVCS